MGAAAPQPGALSCVALFQGLTDAQHQRRRAITEQKEASASHEGAEGFDPVILEALQARETRDYRHMCTLRRMSRRLGRTLSAV